MKDRGVQRRAKGMVVESKGLEYWETLKRLGYTDLELMRKWVTYYNYKRYPNG